MEGKHTATPWALNTKEIPPIIYADNGGEETCIATLDGDVVYAFPDVPTCEANAEFIVRACNAHDDLVKALQALSDVGALSEYLGGGDEVAAAQKLARAALAKAGAA